MEIFTFSERLWRVENNALVCLLCPTNSDCTSQYRPELVGQRPGQDLTQSVSQSVLVLSWTRQH